MPKKFTDLIINNALLIILGFFSLLCLAGIFYDYPLNTVGDESTLLAATLKMIGHYSLRPADPSFYHMPLVVYFYLPFVLIFLITLRVGGVFTSTQSIKEFVILDYYKLIPLARVLNIVLAVISLYLIYRLAREIFKSKKAGLLAATFLSFSLTFVQMAHFAKVWLPQTLAVIITLNFLADLYLTSNPQLKRYLLAGLGVVLSFGVHFIGIIVYIPFLVTHFIRQRELSWRSILNRNFWLANLLIVLFIPFIYYLNPYGFLNYGQSALSLLGISTPSLAVAQVPVGSSFVNAFTFYLKVLLFSEPLLFVLGLIGLVVISFRRSPWSYILGSFLVAYYLGISQIDKFSFYILPIIPVLAVLAVAPFYYLWPKLNKKFSLSLIYLTVFLMAVPVLWFSYDLLRPSSRVLALDWINKNIPTGESIINFDAYLSLNENREAILNIKKYAPNSFNQKRAYLDSLSPDFYPLPDYNVLVWPHYDNFPSNLTLNSWHYLVISSWTPADERKDLKDLSVAGLNVKWVLVKSFPIETGDNYPRFDLSAEWTNPYRLLFNQHDLGPRVNIYQAESYHQDE